MAKNDASTKAMRFLHGIARPCQIDETIAMETTIRDSTARDITAITAIYGHAVLHGRGSFEDDAPDEAEMARRRGVIVDAGYPYLVAERDGVVVGYSYAGELPAVGWKHGVWLDSVFMTRALGDGPTTAPD